MNREVKAGSPWSSVWASRSFNIALGILITCGALVGAFLPLALTAHPATTGTFRTTDLIVDNTSTIGGSLFATHAGDPNGVVSAAKGSLIMDSVTPAVWQNTTGAMVWTKVNITGANTTDPIFGGGLDGAPHFDGVATVLTYAPVTQDGTPKTYIITRDLFLGDGAIVDAGVTLWLQNRRMFCNGTLTNNGHIHNDGRPGIGRLGASGSQVGSLSNQSTGGGGGSFGTGPGGAGTDQSAGTGLPWYWTDEPPSASATNGAGHGQGGGGGAASGNLGGTGGAINVINVGSTASSATLDMISFMTGTTAALGGSTHWAVGTGGGGGGDNDGGGGPGAGGGGGAGGGWWFVACKDVEGTGHLSADGGIGAAGGVGGGGGPTQGAGGGGGGGGGIFEFVYNHNGGNSVTANGAAGGAGAGATGTAGGNGSPGTLVQINLTGDGT